MKNYLLWLLIIIVVLQAYNAIETSPEFHTLSHDDYLKEIQENSKSTNPRKELATLKLMNTSMDDTESISSTALSLVMLRCFSCWLLR